MKEQKQKVAVVGVGQNATNSYLPWLARQKDLEILLFDTLPERSAAAAQKFEARAFESLESLAAAAPDTALVLTRETVRYEVSRQLLDLQIPRLFFEKPLVARNGQAHVDEEDFALGRDLLSRAAEQGCETAMMFNYRFFEQTLRAKKMREERKLGQLIQVSGWINFACWSHAIDLIHAFGGDVSRISASSGETVREGAGNRSPDIAVAFSLAGGGAGTLVGSANEHTIYPFFHLTLAFEGGRLTFTGLDGDLEFYDYALSVYERYAVSRQWSRWDLYNQSFAKALAAYLESITARQPPPVPGLAGLKELQFEAGVRKSLRTGAAVCPAADFPCK
ncbi:MAG: Gfo/Idh/MocA family oxidoreductase [Kiritimatiellia bacterium]|nr:Gfo/Idh/MocA family oxidoreductase [Kiritimatiellia bacterium]